MSSQARAEGTPIVPAAVVGALLAAAGLYLLAEKPLPNPIGLGFFALAGAFLAWQWQSCQYRREGTVPTTSPLRSWLLPIPFALAAGVAGYVALVQRSALFSWAYLGLLLLALVAALWRDGNALEVRRPSLAWVRRPEALVLVVLIAATLAMHLWRYDTVPPAPTHEEASLGVRARELLDGRTATPFETAPGRYPELHVFLVASLLRVGFDPVLALTLVGGLSATAAVLFTYLLAQAAFGPAVGLAAAGLLGLNRWSLLLTRTGEDHGLTLAMSLGAAWLTWRGLSTGRAVWFVLAGIASGIGVIYLSPAVLAPALVLLVVLLASRSAAAPARVALAGTGLALLIAIAVSAPRLAAVVRDQGLMNHYVNTYTAERIGEASTVLDRLVTTAMSLGQRATGRPPYSFGDGAPLLDPLSAALLLLGIGGLLLHALAGPWARFWLLWLVVAAVAAVPTVGTEHQPARTILLFPPLAVGGALVLVGAARGVAELARVPRGAWAVVTLVLAAVAGFTYRDYFVDLPRREQIWASSLPNQIAAGRWQTARAQQMSTAVVVTTPETASGPLFQLTAPLDVTRAPSFQVIGDETRLPFPVQPPPGLDRLWLLVSPEPWDQGVSAWVEQAAQVYYPGGQVEGVAARDGRPLLRVYEWGGEALEAHGKLIADPEARCSGGEELGIGGWRGLLFVPEAGKQSLVANHEPACANLGLRQSNALGREMHLSRGWHELTLVAPGGEMPVLTLERGTQRFEVPPAHLYAGELRPVGLLATFSEAPGSPPIERRYMPTFHYNWGSNPPTENPSFYVEVEAIFEATEPGEYQVHAAVLGPTSVEIDGKAIGDGGQPGIDLKQTLTVGEHHLKLRMHAQQMGATWLRLQRVGTPQRFLDFRTAKPPPASTGD